MSATAEQILRQLAERSPMPRPGDPNAKCPYCFEPMSFVQEGSGFRCYVEHLPGCAHRKAVEWVAANPLPSCTGGIVPPPHDHLVVVSGGEEFLRQAADRIRQNAEMACDPYGIYLRHYTMAATGSPVYGHQEETTRGLAAKAMGARDGLKEKAREKINPPLPLDRSSFEDDLVDMLVEKQYGRAPAST